MYLANPINAFLITKRLTIDFESLLKAANSSTDQNFLSKFETNRQKYKYPTERDVEAAAESLIQLQDVYDLSTRDLADGVLNKVVGELSMSAGDCFFIGQRAFRIEDYFHAELWLLEAMSRLEAEEPPSVARIDILDYLAYLNYEKGDIAKAIQLIEELLEIDPKHDVGLHNLKYYSQKLESKTGSGELNEINEVRSF